jgi:tryptophanyl-tRNA synthetase
VGEDQREHLELMRDVARRFNARYGEDLLVVPEHRIPAVGARIMDLQEPTRKMSTTGGSAEGTVYVLDEAKAIEKKFKRAVTDSDDPFSIRRDPAAKPGVTNLIDITAAARGADPDVVAAELRGDEDRLEEILATGAGKARELAAATLADVRAAMGVGAPRSR